MNNISNSQHFLLFSFYLGQEREKKLVAFKIRSISSFFCRRNERRKFLGFSDVCREKGKNVVVLLFFLPRPYLGSQQRVRFETKTALEGGREEKSLLEPPIRYKLCLTKKGGAEKGEKKKYFHFGFFY